MQMYRNPRRESRLGEEAGSLCLDTDSAWSRRQGQEETGTSQDPPLSCSSPPSAPPGGLAWKGWEGESAQGAQAGTRSECWALATSTRPSQLAMFSFRSGCGA